MDKINFKTDINGKYLLKTLSEVLPNQIKIIDDTYIGDDIYNINIESDAFEIYDKLKTNSRHAGRKPKVEYCTKELIEELLNEGKTLDDIADELEVSKRTLYRRLKE